MKYFKFLKFNLLLVMLNFNINEIEWRLYIYLEWMIKKSNLFLFLDLI